MLPKKAVSAMMNLGLVLLIDSCRFFFNLLDVQGICLKMVRKQVRGLAKGFFLTFYDSVESLRVKP